MDTNWIPNVNFGSGIGGWEFDRIYVNDRENDRVFEMVPVAPVVSSAEPLSLSSLLLGEPQATRPARERKEK